MATRRANPIDKIRPGWLMAKDGDTFTAEDVYLDHNFSQAWTKARGESQPTVWIKVSILARSQKTGYVETFSLSGDMSRITTLWQPPAPTPKSKELRHRQR